MSTARVNNLHGGQCHSMSLEVIVPSGLTDLLTPFVVAVLRDGPDDLVDFAANYFNELREKRQGTLPGMGRGVRFVPGSDDEAMQTDSDDEPMPEPPMKNRYQRRKSVSAERYDPEADEDEGDQRVVHPKSDEQRKRLSEAVKNILIFRSLDIEQMQEVIDAMFEKKTQPNEHVIDQGDDGDNFYVIDSGTYDIYVDDNLVGAYENQGSFGELALMYNMPRAATIIATSAGSIWAMDRHTFRRIVLKNAFNKRKMYENLLETVPMLKTLEPYERMNVADALISKTYEDGTQIIKQGDTADCMYFVESGEVRITVKNDSNDEKEVNRIKTGGYLGELALLTHKPRAASAYAVGTTKCAVLDVQAFERLLGPCMDVMKRNIDEYEEQLAQVFGSKVEITDLR